MERAKAISQLRKLLGPSFAYEVNKNAPDADERAAAAEELKTLTKERDAWAAAMKSRREAILSADADYQALLGAYRHTNKRCDELSAKTYTYRFTAGRANSLFFHVDATGDSWEQVIAIVKKRKAEGRV